MRAVVYPLIVGGGAVVLVVAERHGIAPWLAGPCILVCAAVLVAVLEQWLPYVAGWNRDHGDARTDAAHFAGNLIVSHASLALFVAARELWSGAGAWPSAWPFWAQGVAGLAIVDAGLYAVHRASHGHGWLWRLHAIHHSPRRVYWVNGQRRHLVHELIEGTPGLLVLYFLGAPAEVYAAAIVVVTLHLFLQHANIDYRLGPLRFVFAGAELHRWHHQRRWQDVQGNYAAVFAVWDRVFGTSLGDRGAAPPDVGMDDEPELPTDYLGQIAWPFRARRSVGHVPVRKRGQLGGRDPEHSTEHA